MKTCNPKAIKTYNNLFICQLNNEDFYFEKSFKNKTNCSDKKFNITILLQPSVIFKGY